MKRKGLLNKHFCKNKIQISPTRQQKLAIFTFFHYKSMGSISCHSNQSPYPIKTKTQLFFPPTCRWCVCNMRTIGPAVSEKKIFEMVAGQLGPKTTRTLGIFRTQDESDPSLRQLGPNFETTRTQHQGRSCKQFLFYYVDKTCIKHTYLLKS